MAGKRLLRHKWKLGCLTPFVILALWLGVRWAGTYLTHAVATDYKTYSSKHFGYSVSKYRWQTNGFDVRIEAGSGLDMRFDVSYYELIGIREQRWLAKDRVILLRLDYAYHDSGESRGEIDVLYDFERGELHSFQGAWVIPTPTFGRAVSKDEFETLVRRLEAE